MATPTPTPGANFEAPSPGTDMTGICFMDQLWLKSYPLDRNIVFDYFAPSPFYDWTFDTENEVGTLESKVTKETIDFKEVKRVDHILASLHCKSPPAPPPPPLPEGYTPPTTTGEADTSPETQQKGEPQPPSVDPIIDQGLAKRMKF